MTAGRLTLVASAVVLMVTMSGCSSGSSDGIIRPGGPDGSSATAAPTFQGLTSADVMFAQGMLPHHEQGVELATQALKSVTDPQVRALASRIIDAQSAERDFLKTWLASVPPDLLGQHHHDMMMGMLTPEQMSAFSRLSGEAARSEFLRLMQLHHQGAIDMANARLAQSGTGTMTAFARSVIAEQSAEIDRMKELSSPSN